MPIVAIRNIEVILTDKRLFYKQIWPSLIRPTVMKLEMINFDLHTETLGTINIMSLRAMEKGLELSLLIDPEVPMLLRGDPIRLRQVISNLIDNAIKFTSQGTVSVHLSKEAEDEQHITLRFLVSDTGIGIAADKLKTIFEPFIQADGSTTRKYGGTGLGLTISRNLAELMGGTVGVDSVEGEGATFWFTVVLEKQAKATAAPGVSTSPVTGGSHRMAGICLNKTGTAIRLLLAEDEPTNQLVTKSVITKFGYLVDVANNGSEAVKALESNDYAMVLMDCMMPVLNGYEATAVIRDQASAVRNHAIPVIALTANAFKEDRDKCLAAGMNDYLSKPLVMSDN